MSSRSREQRQSKVFPGVLRVANPQQPHRSSRSTYSKRTYNESDSSLDDVVTDEKGDKSTKSVMPKLIYINPAMEQRRQTNSQREYLPHPQHCVHHLNDYESHTHMCTINQDAQSRNTYNEPVPLIHQNRKQNVEPTEETIVTPSSRSVHEVRTENAQTQTSDHSNVALVRSNSKSKLDSYVSPATSRSESRIESIIRTRSPTSQTNPENGKNVIEMVDVTVQTGDIYVRVASTKNLASTVTTKSYRRPRMVRETMTSDVNRSDAHDEWSRSSNPSTARTTTISEAEQSNALSEAEQTNVISEAEQTYPISEATQTDEECTCMLNEYMSEDHKQEDAVKTPPTSCCGLKKSPKPRKEKEIKPKKGDCKLCTPVCQCPVHMNPCEKNQEQITNNDLSNTDNTPDPESETLSTHPENLSTRTESNTSVHPSNTVESHDVTIKDEEYIHREIVTSEQDPQISIIKETRTHVTVKKHSEHSDQGSSLPDTASTGHTVSSISEPINQRDNALVIARPRRAVKCPCHNHDFRDDTTAYTDNMAKDISTHKATTRKVKSLKNMSEGNNADKKSSIQNRDQTTHQEPSTVLKPDITEIEQRSVTKSVSFQDMQGNLQKKSSLRIETKTSVDKKSANLDNSSGSEKELSPRSSTLTSTISSSHSIRSPSKPVTTNNNSQVDAQSSKRVCTCQRNYPHNDKSISKVNMASEESRQSVPRAKIKLAQTIELDEPAANNAVSKTLIRYRYDLLVSREPTGMGHEPTGMGHKPTPIELREIGSNESLDTNDSIIDDYQSSKKSEKDEKDSDKEGKQEQPETETSGPLGTKTSQESNQEQPKTDNPQTPTATCCGMKRCGKKQKNLKQEDTSQKKQSKLDNKEETLKPPQPTETQNDDAETKSREDYLLSVEDRTAIETKPEGDGKPESEGYPESEGQTNNVLTEQKLEEDANYNLECINQSEELCNCMNPQVKIESCNCPCPCCNPTETPRSEVSDVPENWRNLELPESARSKSSASSRSQAPNLSTSCHGRHRHHSHHYDCVSSSGTTTSKSTSKDAHIKTPIMANSSSIHASSITPLTSHSSSIHANGKTLLSSHSYSNHASSKTPLSSHSNSTHASSKNPLSSHNGSSTHASRKTPQSSQRSSTHASSKTPLSSHISSTHASSKTPLSAHVSLTHASSQTPLTTHISSTHASSEAPLGSHSSLKRESSITPLSTFDSSQQLPSRTVSIPQGKQKQVEVVSTWHNLVSQYEHVSTDPSMNNLLISESSRAMPVHHGKGSTSTATPALSTKDEKDVDDLLSELEIIESVQFPAKSPSHLTKSEMIEVTTTKSSVPSSSSAYLPANSSSHHTTSEITEVTITISATPSSASTAQRRSENIDSEIDTKEAEMFEITSDNEDYNMANTKQPSRRYGRRSRENSSKMTTAQKMPVRNARGSKTVRTSRPKDKFISSYGGVFPVGRDAAPMTHSPFDNMSRSTARRSASPPSWQRPMRPCPPRQCYTTRPPAAQNNYDDIPVRGLVLPPPPPRTPCHQPVRPCHNHTPITSPGCRNRVPHDEIPVKGLPTTEYFFAPSARVCQRCGRVHDPGTPRSLVTVPMVCPNFHVHGTVDVDLTPNTPAQYSGRITYHDRGGLPPRESYNRYNTAPTPYVIPPDNTCAPIICHETLRRQSLPPIPPPLPSPAVFILGRAGIEHANYVKRQFGATNSTEDDCSCAKIQEINDDDEDDDAFFPASNDRNALSREYNSIAANMFGSMWRETNTTESLETLGDDDDQDRYSRERRTPTSNRTIEREMHQTPHERRVLHRELETTNESFSSMDEEPSENDSMNANSKTSCNEERRDVQNKRRNRPNPDARYEVARLVELNTTVHKVSMIQLEPFQVATQMIPTQKPKTTKDQKTNAHQAGTSSSKPRRSSSDKDERSPKWFT